MPLASQNVRTFLYMVPFLNQQSEISKQQAREVLVMEGTNLPVACSLRGPELQERRSRVLRKVGAAVLEVKDLGDGYAYRFPADEIWITELANLISFERQCCPFLRFNIRIEPGAGPIWLELSGPEGTKDVLNSLFE
jgi:hypothetical protein